MSAIANIAIADGAATPVTHTFSPVQTNPLAIFRDTDVAKAYLASQYRITAGSKLNSNVRGLSRVKFTLELPTMGNGVSLPTSEVDYTTTIHVEMIAPNRGVKQERKDARTLCLNALADPQIIDMMDELRAAY